MAGRILYFRKEEKHYQSLRTLARIIPMRKVIDCIASDMGGVLALHSDQSLEKELLRDFGVTGITRFVDLDERLPMLIQRHAKSEIDEDEMWAEFTRLTGVAVPASEESHWGKYFGPELDPAMLALFTQLKHAGYRLVCATNTEPAHYTKHAEAGDYAIFDAVYASCEMGWAKPEAQFYTHILDAEQVAPERVLFIDDLAENCEAANAVGINAYLYTDIAELQWALYDIGVL